VKSFRITSDKRGFRVTGPKVDCAMRWDKVHRITAWKVDLLTFDEIVLRVDDGAAAIQLTEEADGFDAFRVLMEQSLGVDDAWWAVVAQPAFAPCPTTVFERP